MRLLLSTSGIKPQLLLVTRRRFLLRSRPRVSGFRRAVFVELIARPQHAIGDQLQIVWVGDRLHIVSEGASEDAAFAERVVPRDDVFRVCFCFTDAGGDEEFDGVRIDFLGDILLVAGVFQSAGQPLVIGFFSSAERTANGPKRS